MLCLLVAACLTLAHFVHEAWYAREAAMDSGRLTDTQLNFRYAPDAYRIAMPMIVPVLRQAFGITRSSTLAAVFDFVSGFGALFLLYRLVTEELSGQNQRFAASISFLALVQFPFAWVVPYQRPETMPTAIYLALALYAVSRRSRTTLWFAVLIVATGLQSCMRTDVPFLFGLALTLLALLSARFAPSGRRGLSLLHGVAVGALAGGIQWYLQTIRFPHLTYPPDTPAFQLLNNLHRHNMGAALLALVPCLLPLLFLRNPRPVDRLALIAAALYFPLWFTLGVAGEVRIFVPFLLAVCMVGARCLAVTFATDIIPPQNR